MDQELLVRSGHAVVSALDDTGISIKMAMWVHNTDTDTWKLWLVPSPAPKDKLDFYRRLSQIISEHREKLGGIDVSDAELVSEQHPAVRGMAKFLRMEGLGSARFTGNTFNEYYLPDGIVLRSAL